MKATPTTISDFKFELKGYGCYLVTYTSPATSYSWAATITDMRMIDNTKCEEEPKRKDLQQLKAYCKRYGHKFDSMGNRIY